MTRRSLDLLKSLNYNPYIGSSQDVSGAFPTNITDPLSNYVLSNQAIPVTVNGLKPDTVHDVYYNGVNVTDSCVQQGYTFDETSANGIITPSGSATIDRTVTPVTIDDATNPGAVNFSLFLRPSITANTPLLQAASIAEMIQGASGKVEIISKDGTSYGSVFIPAPTYAINEPIVKVIKTPSTPLNSPGGSTADPSQLVTTYSITQPGTQTTTNWSPTWQNVNQYTLLQTFYADPEIVENCAEVNITGIDLFFRSKPTAAAIAGSVYAGVTISICDVENDQPNTTKVYDKSQVFMAAAQINAFNDASVATTFKFEQPIKLTTGRFYGIIIDTHDPNYILWSNKVGDKLVGTNNPSPGVNSNKDGKLYTFNNSGVYNALNDTDLKFNIKAARYIKTTEEKTFVNDNDEYLTTNSHSGTFLGGEPCYKEVSSSNGTINILKHKRSIVGTGTSFTGLRRFIPFVIESGNKRQVLIPTKISNNTHMEVASPIAFTNTAAVYYDTVIAYVKHFDEISGKTYLSGSTANSILQVFNPNTRIIGVHSGATCNVVSVDNISIDNLKIRAGLFLSPESTVETFFNSVVKSGGTYSYDVGKFLNIQPNGYLLNRLFNHDFWVFSRSNEVFEASFPSPSPTSQNKSLVVKANVSVTSTASNTQYSYCAPQIEDEIIDLYTSRNIVSNACDITTSNNVVIDSEVLGNGVALARHISTKVTFNNNRYAEDVRMFMVAYRPLGTQIRCYARLYNSKDPEAFDDKAWTPLTYVLNGDKYSSSDNPNDFVEFELGLPAFSDAANTLPGTFSAEYNSNSIQAANTTGQITGYVANNDVIRIYNSLFPDTNYQVAVVKEANTSHILIGGVIESNNVVGEGYSIDRVKYSNIAFNNINNTNISRYYNSALAEFDTFDSMQVKVVLLADNTNKVPRVDHIQVLGVSA